MKTVLVTLTLLLSSAVLAVEEGRESSEAFLKYCISAEKVLDGGKLESTSEMVDAVNCLKYLDGFRDGLRLYTRPQIICIPREVTDRQLVRVVMKYLRENPSKLHLDKVQGATDALRAAYPCR
jgi:Ssp1 endopeptidase immunity protein Rap1a